MSGLYERESARRYLLECGARLLAKGDPEIPVADVGEYWLLPTAWGNCSQVVVHFGEFYPDEPPSIYWPKTLTRPTLMPHVNSFGKICTGDDDTIVNPLAPVEILHESLEQAEKIVGKSYNSVELVKEIAPELKAYWYGAGGLVHYFPQDLRDKIFLLEPLNSKKIMWRVVQKKQAFDLRQQTGLGLVFDIPLDDSPKFLASPAEYLTNSDEFRRELMNMAGIIYAQKRNSRAVTFFICARVAVAKGEVFLFGKVGPNNISIRRKNSQQLFETFHSAIKEKINPCLSEDLSMERLLKRAEGALFNVKIFEKKVAIVGCGSLGSMLTDALVRSGIKHFLLIDPQSLSPENLARHLLASDALYQNKAEGLALLIKRRFPDAEVEWISDDFRSLNSLRRLEVFNPDLIVFATGDTNVDLTAAQLGIQGRLSARCYAWIEHHLIAGHIVYEKSHTTESAMLKLHADSGTYCYHLSEGVNIQQEAGCQTTFTPYSGLQMIQFSAILATQIITWLNTPPTHSMALRWQIETNSIENMPCA